MIRKFLCTTNHASGLTITLKIAPNDSYKYTWDMSNGWHDGLVSFTEQLAWMLSQGWKEVTSGIDPNDLQGNCTHPTYDITTDSCKVCGKDWTSILWAGKPCCGGGVGKTALYGNGKWHDSDCDSLKPPRQSTSDFFGPGKEPDYRAKPYSGGCQCGAWATSNTNAHSYWCPQHKK